MSLSKKRYALPTMVFIIIGGFAIQLILYILESVPPTDVMSVFSSPNLGTDIVLVIAIAMPIIFLEFFLFAVPGAGLLLFISKMYKAASYEMNIMNLGREFGGSRMIRRAATPALFALAFSEAFKIPIQNFLFGGAPSFAGEYMILYGIVLSLMSALLFMPIALLLFMPTWVLNDAGVVTHLKSDKMRVRQPPDTQGVGRWAGTLLGGYALIAFPITMFMSHFYEPYIFPGGTLISIGNLIPSILWVIGLPLFVIAFILPVVVLNEAILKRTNKRVWRLAKRFGATVVKKERVEKVKKIGRPTGSTVTTTEPGLEPETIYDQREFEQVVSTAKTVKVQTPKKKKKDDTKETKKTAKAAKKSGKK